MSEMHPYFLEKTQIGTVAIVLGKPMATPCLMWTGNTVGAYGQWRDVTENYKPKYAHRYALECLLERPIANGMQASHLCDVKLCVKGDHLIEESHLDNRRRNSYINMSLARLIRQGFSEGSTRRELANQHNVKYADIRNIVSNMTWKEPDPMKLYLAAAFSRQQEMRDYADELEGMGLHVTSRWLTEPPKPLVGQQKFLRDRALDDVADIRGCDVLVRFTDDLSASTIPSQLATGGKMFETGLAYSLAKTVYIVGGHQNIFDNLPGIQHVKDFGELKRTLSPVEIH